MIAKYITLALLLSVLLVDAFVHRLKRLPRHPLQLDAKKKLYSFEEARRFARAQNHGSLEEFLAYDCPGAYQLPKNCDEIYKDEGWIGWEDFLGIIYTFDEARQRVREMNCRSEAEYRQLQQQDARLPAEPEIKYQVEWHSWKHFLEL